MAMVQIIFGDDLDNLTVNWSVRQTGFAQRWLNQLRLGIESGIYERDRIHNFPSQNVSRQDLIDQLIGHMQVIDDHVGGFFDVWPYVGMPPEITNGLHVCFERLRGSIYDSASIYDTAPYDVKHAIQQFNVLIHRYEGYGKPSDRRVIVSFNDENRVPLMNDDYGLFQMHHAWGELTLNYVQVGKHFLEMFHSQDEDMTDDAIRPMRVYGAGFVAHFYERKVSGSARKLEQFNEWFDLNSERFNRLGFHKGDPTLALGSISVADIVNDGFDQASLESEIGRLSRVHDVRIIE